MADINITPLIDVMLVLSVISVNKSPVSGLEDLAARLRDVARGAGADRIGLIVSAPDPPRR